ncbi:hypothetical protein V9K67_07685 [Paraflavisolibacter sp. H34]|uniref:hypothetical protein n=1 Tax=Huijunlia imazamoxiresistens TaxID=3127457 RepID=UPI0030167922
MTNQNKQGNIPAVSNFLPSEYSAVAERKSQRLENAVPAEALAIVSPAPALVKRKEVKRKYVGYQGL